MTNAINFQSFQGEALLPMLDALGSLRIRVFREYPYLYDGDLAYERAYLKAYASSVKSLVVMVFDGEEAVGATTCMPMAEESGEFQEPFLKAGWDVEEIVYFGESILLPEYRGRGIGKAFFQYREAHARSLHGMRWMTFCAVDRPDDHPSKPVSYRPLEPFWQSLGYTKRPDFQTRFSWKEVGEATESLKSLTFWTKPLA